jgi:peptide/nickel transport system permease protein
MFFARYLLRRSLFALILIVVISSSALLLTLAAPGDVTVQLWPELDPLERERLRAALGLDRPILVQYTAWAWRAVRLDLGTSVLYGRPVTDLIGERALNTAVLATSALVVATLLGIPTGVYTGSRQRGVGVRVIRIVSVLLLSTPPLLASLALVLVAARTGWFPIGGMVSAAASDAPWSLWLSDLLRHIPLPTLALALPLAAMLERLQSQAMSQASREPFVQAAQARGLSADHALLKHGWRVSLGPVLGLYGVMLGSLFSGSFIVELVTAWPGLGRLMIDALQTRDLYLAAGCAAVGALFLACGTLLSDVLLAIADPRARFGAPA